jgi:hypothetical protein
MLAVAALAATVPSSVAQAPSRLPVPRRVPIIYSSDLFHPHDDPDDHFDLATLFAIREFDVKAVLLDLGERQRPRPGRIPLEQMFALSGRKVPYATGLSAKLDSPDDKALSRPAEDQAAIELLLRTLAEADEPVTVITAGSLRDVAAAFNREPELLRRKISRLYVNIGNADGGNEWNVGLDVHAYVRIMRSGLPVYWCPCQPFKDPRSTYWDFKHADVLDRAPTGVQNFFIYALQAVPPELIDPVAALRMDFRPWRHLVWSMQRQMWCTASFLHAAGLDAVRQADSGFTIAPVAPGGPAGEIFTFVPACVQIDDAGRTRVVPDPPPNMHVFKSADPGEYSQAMTRCLAILLERFPVEPGR